MDRSDFFIDQQEILIKIPPRKLVTAWLQQLNMISLCTKEGVRGGAELKVEERGNIYLTTENGLT